MEMRQVRQAGWARKRELNQISESSSFKVGSSRGKIRSDGVLLAQKVRRLISSETPTKKMPPKGGFFVGGAKHFEPRQVRRSLGEGGRGLTVRVLRAEMEAPPARGEALRPSGRFNPRLSAVGPAKADGTPTFKHPSTLAALKGVLCGGEIIRRRAGGRPGRCVGARGAGGWPRPCRPRPGRSGSRRSGPA